MFVYSDDARRLSLIPSKVSYYGGKRRACTLHLHGSTSTCVSCHRILRQVTGVFLDYNDSRRSFSTERHVCVQVFNP